MSGKPFFILNVVDGKPGRLWTRDTFEEAVDFAVGIVLEQVDPEDGKPKEQFAADVKFEISHDLDWWRKGGDIAVYILQTENE